MCLCKLKSRQRIWFIIFVSLQRCISLHGIAFHCTALHCIAGQWGVVQACDDATTNCLDPSRGRSPDGNGTGAVVGNRCPLFESRQVILILWPPSP